MIRGVGGLGNYQYLLQPRQSQGSIGNANPSAFQSAMQSQLQGAQSSTDGNLPAFLVSLLGNAGGTGSTSTSTGATGSLASQQGTVGGALSETDANGESSVSEDGVKGAVSGHHHHHHGGTGASMRAGSSTLADQLFAQSDTDGDGSMPQSGATGSQGDSATSQPTATTGVSSFLQQAISKYMLLSPAGGGVAALGSVLATV